MMQEINQASPRIAVLIPCYNEAPTVAKVVQDFRRELPEATVYVFDNASTDSTAQFARASGAVVVPEPRRGKGFVVSAMLEKVAADYYVMVDGDDTYEAASVKELLAPVLAGDADMVVGARLAQFDDQSFRTFHVAGNNVVRWLVNRIFNARLTDIMSGYRAFNQELVRRIPLISCGFEIETEMTIQMLHRRRRIIEVQVPYRGRPEGSHSKLNTFRDGARVLWRIFSLFRAFKPLTFFGGAGVILFVLGVMTGAMPIYDLLTREPVVRHMSLLISAVALVLLAAGSVFVGVLLHALNWRFMELHDILGRRLR